MKEETYTFEEFANVIDSGVCVEDFPAFHSFLHETLSLGQLHTREIILFIPKTAMKTNDQLSPLRKGLDTFIISAMR